MIVVICFRNLYLWYSDTTKIFNSTGIPCCDLLSKFISLIFWYNATATETETSPVVICFRNLYLWYSDTTCYFIGAARVSLWFAFEIYIFDILIQLLFCLCLCVRVVICFRNLYLWYSDTTSPFSEASCSGCDLLSKFISLIFWYNRLHGFA